MTSDCDPHQVQATRGDCLLRTSDCDPHQVQGMSTPALLASPGAPDGSLRRQSEVIKGTQPPEDSMTPLPRGRFPPSSPSASSGAASVDDETRLSRMSLASLMVLFTRQRRVKSTSSYDGL